MIKNICKTNYIKYTYPESDSDLQTIFYDNKEKLYLDVIKLLVYKDEIEEQLLEIMIDDVLITKDNLWQM